MNVPFTYPHVATLIVALPHSSLRDVLWEVDFFWRGCERFINEG